MSDKRQSDFIRSIVDPEGLKREEELHKQFIQAVPEREVAKGCPRCAELQQDLHTTADALGHMKRQFEAVNQDRDDWIACHAKIFRELQETKTLLGNKCAEVERLTRERDALVSAIDNEMVVSHIGVFNLGDDPKIALNKLMCYAQGLGEYFAKEQLAEAQRASKSVAMALCRWKCGSISGDELAVELFAVFASAPSIEAMRGKEGGV